MSRTALLLTGVLGMALVSGGCAAPATAKSGLLGQALYRKASTVEGPVLSPEGMRTSAICKNYQCVSDNGSGDYKTGFSMFLLLNWKTDAAQAMDKRDKGAYYPEVSVYYENNTVDTVSLYLGKRPEKTLPAATLNLLLKTTELALGSPVSSQKISGCYAKLQKEASCLVASGKLKTNSGKIRPYEVAFTTTDDGSGYSTVDYKIYFND